MHSCIFIPKHASHRDSWKRNTVHRTYACTVNAGEERHMMRTRRCGIERPPPGGYRWVRNLGQASSRRSSRACGPPEHPCMRCPGHTAPKPGAPCFAALFAVAHRAPAHACYSAEIPVCCGGRAPAPTSYSTAYDSTCMMISHAEGLRSMLRW